MACVCDVCLQYVWCVCGMCGVYVRECLVYVVYVVGVWCECVCSVCMCVHPGLFQQK